MPTELEALTAIPARYRQVLTDHLHLATCRDLVLIDREAVRQGMRAARKKPPSLEEVAQWQDLARRYRPAPSDNSDPWQTTASFVVCFQQRLQPDQSWERRIEVEHTEVEPEQAPAAHDGWDCHWVCTWMRDRLALPTHDPSATGPLAPSPDPTTGRRATPAVPTSSAEPPPPRLQLAFTKVTLTGPDGAHDLTGATEPVRTRQPAQLAVALSGPLPADARLAVQIRTPSQRSRNIYEQPLAQRTATIDLTGLTVGSQTMTVVAWTPGDTSDPAILKPPALYVDTNN